MARRSPPALEAPVALVTSPPQVWHRARTELDIYAARAKAVTIRHATNHRVVAIVEIVSPGEEEQPTESFTVCREICGIPARRDSPPDRRPVSTLSARPARDPQGNLGPISGQRLYPSAGSAVDAGVLHRGPDTRGIRQRGGSGPGGMPEMPLFLTPDQYVRLTLETAYQSAWEAVPTFWQNVLQNSRLGTLR